VAHTSIYYAMAEICDLCRFSYNMVDICSVRM